MKKHLIVMLCLSALGLQLSAQTKKISGQIVTEIASTKSTPVAGLMYRPVDEVFSTLL